MFYKRKKSGDKRNKKIFTVAQKIGGGDIHRVLKTLSNTKQ